MLSLRDVKTLIGKPEISDNEAELVRNEMRSLAEVVVESFIKNRIKPEITEKYNLNKHDE